MNSRVIKRLERLEQGRIDDSFYVTLIEETEDINLFRVQETIYYNPKAQKGNRQNVFFIEALSTAEADKKYIRPKGINGIVFMNDYGNADELEGIAAFCKVMSNDELKEIILLAEREDSQAVEDLNMHLKELTQKYKKQVEDLIGFSHFTWDRHSTLRCKQWIKEEY